MLAVFALVPLPSAGKTSLGVFNVTATRTFHVELLKIKAMDAKNIKTIQN